MLKPIACALLVGSLLAAGVSAPQETDAAAGFRLAVAFRDGTTLVGTPNTTVVPIHAKYLKADVAWEHIQSITVCDDGKTAVVKLATGDTLTGVVDLAPLRLTGTFGDLDLDDANILSVRVVQIGQPRRSHLDGTRLIACYSPGKVVEVDRKTGKVVWECKAYQPLGAERLANGNTLIAEYGRRVIEVDHGGKIVWEYKIGDCVDARQLPNGNELISAWSGKKAIEVTGEGNIVWSYNAGNYCGAAQRLPNGNTVVAAYNSVVEVAPSGAVVWRWDGGVGVYGAHRLANGNTLVADLNGKKVVEISPEKKIVWEVSHASPRDAFRLPNGNTLITGEGGCIEVTPAKKIVWTHAGFDSGTARG